MIDKNTTNVVLTVAKWKRALSQLLVICAISIMMNASFSINAHAETRSLKLYYIHTKEKIDVVYKKDGKYVSSALQKLNRFLRDFRRNEPTKMDPALFDIVWEVYKATGSREYIHVVSAYRSPATNELLRRTRGGQATKSQHMVGKAMDFYIPGVPVKKLRELGFRIGGGGVGYYPRSAVPFVHLDTGNVRAWPRMSRQELTSLFPKGGTLHLPPDGKPLPGYQQALAKYKARKNGSSKTTILADNSSSKSKKGNILTALFGGGDEDEESFANEVATTARPAAPVQTPTKAPQTLMASLPAEALPIPSAAPRRTTQAAIPIVVNAAPAEIAPQPSNPITTIAMTDLPTPQSRPTVLIARAEPPENRRTATQIEQELAVNEGSQAIAAAINEAEQNTAPTTELAYAYPVPEVAPRRAPTQSETVTAAAPVEIPTPQFENSKGSKSGRVVKSNFELASLDPEIVTTPKAARPTSRDNAQAQAPVKSRIVPADQIDQSRFGNWSTTKASLTTDGRASERPDFIQNATRAVPTVIYTAGFSTAPPPSSNSFSGNAVTFLAVAKFENGTGTGGSKKGEPLQIQVPN